MTDFLEEQAKRLYGLGELEGEALEVLRLIVRQTERVRTWKRRSHRPDKGNRSPV
jgi:hypothetical protein